MFLDADILVLEDIAKLFELADDKYYVMVSKNEKIFEWASVMLFNNAKCKILTPEYIETTNALHTISWTDESNIGDLPRDWNVLVGYDNPIEHPKLVHFTQGNPLWPETIDCDYSQVWHDTHKSMNSAIAWSDLLGNSVHAVHVNGVPLPRFLFDEVNKEPHPRYRQKVMELLHKNKALKAK